MDRLTQLEEQLNIAPDDKYKIALLEEAIDIMLQQNRLKEAYDYRCELIELSTTIGFPLKGLVAFSQNLAYVDEIQNEELQWDLMWEYRWIISIAPNFHQISWQQIEDLLKDFKKRLLKFGDSIRAYYTMSFVVAMRIHDLELAQKFRRLRLPSPMGHLDECEICIEDDEVAFLAFVEGYWPAKEKAKKILDGTHSCDNVPNFTYLSLINAALLEGEYQEAAIFRQKILDKMEGQARSVYDIGYILISYVAEKMYKEALALFQKYYTKSLDPSISGIALLNFHMGAFLLFASLRDLDPQSTFTFPFEIQALKDKDKKIDAMTLSQHFKQNTLKGIEAFDQRNANTYFAEQFESFKKVLK